jgi:hypothetical protein
MVRVFSSVHTYTPLYYTTNIPAQRVFIPSFLQSICLVTNLFRGGHLRLKSLLLQGLLEALLLQGLLLSQLLLQVQHLHTK